MDQLLLLIQSHAWAPLSILVMLWVYRALADDSKFPITWPAGWSKWKPMLIIGFGQVICVTKAIAVDHNIWYIAVEHGVIISFMALGGVHILRNWWPVEGTEPKWLRMFVLVFSKVVAEVSVTVAKEADATDPDATADGMMSIKETVRVDDKPKS